MQVTPKLRTRLLLQNGVFVVLLVALAALVAFFAREYRALGYRQSRYGIWVR